MGTQKLEADTSRELWVTLDKWRSLPVSLSVKWRELISLLYRVVVG